jgi:hypothetical protein
MVQRVVCPVAHLRACRIWPRTTGNRVEVLAHKRARIGKAFRKLAERYDRKIGPTRDVLAAHRREAVSISRPTQTRCSLTMRALPSPFARPLTRA